MELWICAVMLAVCVVTDIRRREIPNAVLLCGAIAALVLMVHNGIGYVLLGAAVPLVQWPLYRKGVMGAGDIKLQMAVGGLMGPMFAWQLVLCSVLCGGVLAVGVWLWRAFRKTASDRTFAYAPAIAAGFAAACVNLQ